MTSVDNPFVVDIEQLVVNMVRCMSVYCATCHTSMGEHSMFELAFVVATRCFEYGLTSHSKDIQHLHFIRWIVLILVVLFWMCKIKPTRDMEE